MPIVPTPLSPYSATSSSPFLFSSYPPFFPERPILTACALCRYQATSVSDIYPLLLTAGPAHLPLIFLPFHLSILFTNVVPHDLSAGPRVDGHFSPLPSLRLPAAFVFLSDVPSCFPVVPNICRMLAMRAAVYPLILTQHLSSNPRLSFSFVPSFCSCTMSNRYIARVDWLFVHATTYTFFFSLTPSLFPHSFLIYMALPQSNSLHFSFRFSPFLELFFRLFYMFISTPFHSVYSFALLFFFPSCPLPIKASIGRFLMFVYTAPLRMLFR